MTPFSIAELAPSVSADASSRALVALLQAVHSGASEEELMGMLASAIGARIPDVPLALHARDPITGKWRLAAHRRLMAVDADVLARTSEPPEPIGAVKSLRHASPIAHDRAPWPGLSAALFGECVVMPALHLDGFIAGTLTAFTSSSAELRAALTDAAPFLWVIRGKVRHTRAMNDHSHRYAALAECSPDSIWRIDDHHRVAYVNKTYERVTGTSAEQCVGRHVLDCVPPAAHNAWLNALALIDAPGRTSEVFYAHHERHFAARLAAETDATNRVTGVVATIRDVTDRFRWAADLEAATVRGQVVADVTRSVVYDRRLADETAYVSPSMKKVFGYEPDQFARGGLSWWIDRIHPDDRTKFAAMFASHENRGTTQWCVEYRVRRRDETWATVLDQGRLIVSGDPSTARAVGAVTDVTVVRALEAQVNHGHRVELIGRLAGGVAHDFNNVLSAIGGFTELLQHSTPATDPRTADLLEIAALVKRASGLTQNLLGLSRRRDHSQPVILEVSHAVLRLAPTLRTLLGSGVSLVIEPIAESLDVSIDPGHFDQIVLNLAVNARDAMPDGGTVTISAVLGDPSDGSGTAPYVRLEVSDRGLGIPPDVLKKIFTPFLSAKPEAHGTGVGLSVVHDMVTAAGGSIGVTSENNRGTTFAVRLPLASREQPNPAHESATVAVAATNGTVLLVEDEEAVRRSTRRILERAGYAVIEARTGDAGLASLLAHRPHIDVVVSDLYMPGLSGPALVERMRTEAPEIGCLVISGHAERFAKLAPEEGALAIVTKPCRGATLISVIGGLVEATRRRRGRECK